jgi:CheY-like chemotaxis protein
MKSKLNCILLIDDDETTNYVNTILINKAECAEEVKSVTSGHAALEYLRSIGNDGRHPQPDLIFLDINMPVMNGWEFIEEYHQLLPEQRGQVLVWMLSTSDNPADRERAEKLGSDGFMAKPLTISKLMDVVRRYFKHLFEA